MSRVGLRRASAIRQASRRGHVWGPGPGACLGTRSSWNDIVGTTCRNRNSENAKGDSGAGAGFARRCSPAPRVDPPNKVVTARAKREPDFVRLTLRAFRRRRLHRRAGEREWAWLRLRQTLRLVGRGLGLRLLVLVEDLLFGRAGEQALELILVDRFALDQDRRDLVQLSHVLLEHGDGELMRLLDHALDLVVDLAGDLLGVLRLVAHLTAEERHVVVAAEHAGAELVAHAVAHDRLLRDRRYLLEVVRGPGRHLVEDELLRSADAESHCQLLHQRGLRRQVAVFARQRDRVPKRLATADHGNLVHIVGVLEVMTDEGVAELVVSGDLPLLLGEQAGLLLGPGDHAHDPFLELLLLDHLLAAASGEQRCLVDEVREVGAGETGRTGGERVEVDLGRDRLALGVHLQDLAAADAVRPVDDDLAVEAAGAQQCRVEDVRPVRGRDQDDVVLQLEPVHLDEELVQGLLALVVTAAEAGAAVAADGIDLVHEDDARGGLLGLLEEVADARGADADEHLDKVRAGDREERYARLAGNGTSEQGLTGAGRSVEQHALRDPRAERLELLRVLEELFDLVQFLDGLVHAGDILEADLRRVRRHPLGTALTEAHHLRAAALDLVHQEDPEGKQQHERQ